jgi:hypothetical protein
VYYNGRDVPAAFHFPYSVGLHVNFPSVGRDSSHQFTPAYANSFLYYRLSLGTDVTPLLDLCKFLGRVKSHKAAAAARVVVLYASTVV